MAEENQIYLDDDLEETGENSRITASQVEAVVESIDKKLTENPDDKVLKKKAREFKKDILPRKQKYERAFAIFKGPENIVADAGYGIYRNYLFYLRNRWTDSSCPCNDALASPPWSSTMRFTMASPSPELWGVLLARSPQ